MFERFKDRVKRLEHRHHVLAALLVGTGIVLLWRGIWDLADVYLFPSQDVLSAAVSILIGFLILYSRNFDLKEFFS